MQPLAGYIMPVGTHIIATEPRADVRRLIPGNEAVADLNFVLDYFRRSPDDRLLFGGRVSLFQPPPSLKSAMLARAVRVFPQLRDARVEYVWGGNVDITRTARHSSAAWPTISCFCHGFSGHGLALTGMAGKLAGGSDRRPGRKVRCFHPHPACAFSRRPGFPHAGPAAGNVLLPAEGYGLESGRFLKKAAQKLLSTLGR